MSVQSRTLAAEGTTDATWLIAAHTWETNGAQSFVWKAAFIIRGVNAHPLPDTIPAADAGCSRRR